MCFAEAVKVNEEVIPGLLLLVAVLEGLKGEEGGTPGEGGDKVAVRADDVKGAANLRAGSEVRQNASCVVCRRRTGED